MDDFLVRIERMGAAIAPAAKAKAERVYIENYMRCKKALLMQESTEKTSVAKEMYAYSHPDYIALVDGLREAVEIEEKARWALEKFKVEFSHWQTCCANERWQQNHV